METRISQTRSCSGRSTDDQQSVRFDHSYPDAARPNRWPPLATRVRLATRARLATPAGRPAGRTGRQ
jgi:hypothetical protein